MQELRHKRAAMARKPAFHSARNQLFGILSLGLLLIVISACSTPSVTKGATPIPHVKPIAMQIRGALATPVSTSAPLDMETSQNWSGYSFPRGDITGVQAQWTEPDVSTLANGFMVTWIGIGGWGESYNNIVQIGTLAYTDQSGVIQHIVWYETLPPNHWIWIGSVAAGDSISASIMRENKSVETWDLSLIDKKSGQIFPVSVAFHSPRVYADFIVEDPDATSNNGPPYYPFPHFQPLTFHNANIRYTQGWVPIGAVPGMQITLVQSGQALARPGPLVSDTFTVSRVGP